MSATAVPHQPEPQYGVFRPHPTRSHARCGECDWTWTAADPEAQARRHTTVEGHQTGVIFHRDTDGCLICEETP